MNKYVLGEIADVKTGPFGTQLKASEYVSDGIPIINVKNIGFGNLIKDNMDYVDLSTCERLEEHILKENDIVFGRKGSVDRHCIIRSEEDGWLQGSDCIRVRIHNDKINPQYVSCYLMQERVKKQLNNVAVGSTMASMNSNIIKSITMELPPIEEQNIIANFFEKIHQKIENNNRINQELEEMAKTIYDYWFLQFEFPNAEWKPYKSSGGKMVWNEELKREIPEGWEVCKVNKVLKEVPKSRKLNTNEYKDCGKYPIIDQSSDYICGYIDDDSIVINVSEAIVFGDHTKVVKYINFPFARGADGTQILISNNEKLPNYLLYQQISSMNLVSQGYSRYFKFLKDKYIVIPTERVACQFKNALGRNCNMLKETIFQNKELISLRDFLLPLLMNGQVGFENDIMTM